MMYELLYIVPTQYTDAEVETIKGTVSGLIAAQGGTVTKNESVGKLKLAYPIKKVRHGTYVLAHFNLEPENVSVLDQKLRLTNEVLRYQMLSLPPGAEARTFQMVSYVAPLSEEARAEEPSRAPVRAAAPASMPMKREEPSLSIEELDKKLDEILDADEKV